MDFAKFVRELRDGQVNQRLSEELAEVVEGTKLEVFAGTPEKR